MLNVKLGPIVSALLFGLVHYIPDNPWRSVVALQAVMVFTGLGLTMRAPRAHA